MATVSAAPEPQTAGPALPRISLSLVAIAVLCLAALAPLLFVHVQQLWVRPHYQFFPLVLIGAGVLLWSRRAEFHHVQPGSSAVTIGLLAFAWLLLAGAELLNSSWLAAVAALFLLLPILQALGLVRRLFVVWLYLWLLIPPPFGWDNTLIISLQTLTTRWSSSLLDLVRVQHVIAGHIMEVGGQRLFVEEACAGINSLFSILACALFYIFLMRIPVLRAVVLLLASVGWVLVANVARVFFVAYLPKHWDINVGWRHDALGYVLFALALGLIVSTHRLLLFFTPFSNPDADAAHSPSEPPSGQDGPAWTTLLNQSRLNSWIVGGAFGLLLVTHFAVYRIPPSLFSSPDRAFANARSLNEDSMPRDLVGWRRDKWSEEQRSVRNAYGEFSKSWTYQGDAQYAMVSVDYPFPDWHDLSQCYYGQGWDIEGITNQASVEPGQPTRYCEMKLKKSGLRWGHVIYCQVDSTGQTLTPPERGAIAGTIYRQQSLLSRLLAWDTSKADAAAPVAPVYQVQLFVESFAPLTANDEERVKARFFRAFSELKGPLFENVALKPKSDL